MNDDQMYLVMRDKTLEDLDDLMKSRKAIKSTLDQSNEDFKYIIKKVVDVCSKVKRHVFSPSEKEELKSLALENGVSITRSLRITDFPLATLQTFESAVSHVEQIGVINNKPPRYMIFENERVWCRWLRRVKVEKSIDELCKDIINLIEGEGDKIFDTNSIQLSDKEKLAISISDVFNRYTIQEFGYRAFDPSLLLDLDSSRLRSFLAHIYSQPTYVDYLSRVGSSSLTLSNHLSDNEMLMEVKNILLNSGMNPGMILEKLGQIII